MQDVSAAAVVRFYVLPLAACALERSWRHAAKLLLKQGSQPPFVTVNGRLIQKGGKFSERLIKEELELIGIRRNR
jgi:hypothetical protein